MAQKCRFKFIGSLALSSNERYFAHEVKVSESGWETTRTRLVMNALGNKMDLEISSGMRVSDRKIFTVIKDGEPVNGKQAYKSMQISYADRLNYLDKIADFKKAVFVNGSDRTEFATNGELANFVFDKFDKESAEYTGKKYQVEGEFSISQVGDKTYPKYSIDRIYVVPNETEEMNKLNLELYVGDDAISDKLLDESGILLINGFVAEYDSTKKDNKGIPVTIERNLNSLPADKRGFATDVLRGLFENKGDDEGNLSTIGVSVNVISKNETVEFNESNLTDDQKQLIELGFCTLDNIRQEMGIGKGTFQRRFEFSEFTRGYSKGSIPSKVSKTQLLSDVKISNTEDVEFY